MLLYREYDCPISPLVLFLLGNRYEVVKLYNTYTWYYACWALKYSYLLSTLNSRKIMPKYHSYPANFSQYHKLYPEQIPEIRTPTQAKFCCLLNFNTKEIKNVEMETPPPRIQSQICSRSLKELGMVSELSARIGVHLLPADDVC